MDVLVFLAGVGDAGCWGRCGGGGVEGAWGHMREGEGEGRGHKGGVYVWNVLQLRDGVGAYMASGV